MSEVDILSIWLGSKLGKVLADGTVEIPVVFNVIYNTSAQNVSDARIAEQIAVLNADYGATNSDITKIPSAFQPSAAGDVKIRFKLINAGSQAYTALAMASASCASFAAWLYNMPCGLT